MYLKVMLRKMLIALHLDLTKNLEYDRLTEKILKQVLKPNSNCIDVGCHKGEVLDSILTNAPAGKHYGFEPIPHLFHYLKEKYDNQAIIYPFALSDINGTSTFNIVRNDEAFSGLKIRHYDFENPVIDEVVVETRRLDDILDHDLKIDLIKIDVEGNEFAVLKGAETILRKSRPIIIYENGLGASDYYGTQPLDVYNFLTKQIGLKIATLKMFINKTGSLSDNEYLKIYNNQEDYYFIAFP
jgi:FkbM family methyltransferase